MKRKRVLPLSFHYRLWSQTKLQFRGLPQERRRYRVRVFRGSSYFSFEEMLVSGFEVQKQERPAGGGWAYINRVRRLPRGGWTALRGLSRHPLSRAPTEARSERRCPHSTVM